LVDIEAADTICCLNYFVIDILKRNMSDRQNIKISGHHAYCVLSIACPVVSVAAAIIFQSLAHSDFWNSITPEDDADRAAGAMMAMGEVITILFYLTVGCVIGVLLALKSVLSKQKLSGIGLLALVVNALPLILLALYWSGYFGEAG
jgi:hypothetical protein